MHSVNQIAIFKEVLPERRNDEEVSGNKTAMHQWKCWEEQSAMQAGHQSTVYDLNPKQNQ